MNVIMKRNAPPLLKRKYLPFWLLILILGLIIVTDIAFSADLPVIPDAQGWGITTPAGRGGDVYRVTNLESEGPGSLRAAVEASGPRVVVFEVSGTITIRDTLDIVNPYITIAGQTAPSPGITLRGGGLVINTHDVLVQHMRMRVGDEEGYNPENRDGIEINAENIPDLYNVVVDHCSVSWAIDGNLDLWGSPLHDVTIRYCIFSEALHESIHPSEDGHSTGLLIGDGAKNITIFANVFAHNDSRNPRMNGDTTSEIINNLIYNWFWFATRTDSPVNIIGNHYISGPSTSQGAKGIRVQSRDTTYPLEAHTVYIAENIGPGRLTDAGDDWLAVGVEGDVVNYRTDTPYVEQSDLVAMDVNEVLPRLTSQAGARPVDRDTVDVRVIKNVVDGTGKIINSQRDVGGWPELAVNERKLTLPDNENEDDDGDGYTNMEEWLHTYAREVEGTYSPTTSSEKKGGQCVIGSILSAL